MRRMKKHWLRQNTINRIIFILCWLTGTALFAQDIIDTELWTGATFELQLNKKFRAEIEQQVRFDDTLSSYKGTFTEPGLRYKLNKHISFKVKYRYTIRPDDDNRSRISVSGYYSWSKKKFPLSFQYRLKFQDTKEQNTEKKFTFLRNKFTLEYNLSKKADPFLAFEHFYRFNQKNEPRAWRFTAGFDWKLTKSLELSTYNKYEEEGNVKKPKANHIIGIMFTYEAKIKG